MCKSRRMDRHQDSTLQHITDLYVECFWKKHSRSRGARSHDTRNYAVINRRSSWFSYEADGIKGAMWVVYLNNRLLPFHRSPTTLAHSWTHRALSKGIYNHSYTKDMSRIYLKLLHLMCKSRRMDRHQDSTLQHVTDLYIECFFRKNTRGLRGVRSCDARHYAVISRRSSRFSHEADD